MHFDVKLIVYVVMTRKQINAKWPNAVATRSGLKYIITKKGCGEATPQKGQKIVAHYTGKLLDGTIFDSTVDRNEPIETSVGLGGVIKGCDEAFAQMRKGEQRTLIVPPELAYGETGIYDFIPSNATLVFDVELLDF